MNVAKLTILQDTFKKQFSIERFKKFTREFFNEPEMLLENRRTGIWREYDNHIKSYYMIAKYTDSENNNLIVLAVELKKDSSIDRARSMQRNFISKILDENKLEAAIVAFYTENDPIWRLSFVRLDYSFKETGISLDLTPARRYSYLLGENEPNNTAQAQLLRIFEDDRHNPTLNEIENAFSVEKVTKEFFSQYKEKYFNLKEYLDEDPTFIAESKKLGFEVGKFSEQFAKKLMGQLAFLYFLQKKGWLGVRIMPKNHTLTEPEFRNIYTIQDQAHKNVLDKVFKITKDKNKKLSSKVLSSINNHEAALLSDCFIGTIYDLLWGSGNRNFIREIFDFCINHTTKNFFNDYLEPFFYEALNTKRKNQYFKTFNCKIPFLNGGLFEPLEGYHWQDIDFEIPNELFSNKEQKGREADGILDIFERFNFTINEDEPLEKEVAVDPEMLGKIFENLLDASDRKSKGAFYTPREIVHYMCQESLINYLVNEVNVPYEDMKQFILYGELIRDADSRRNVGYGKQFTIKQSIYDNIVKIDEALINVRVADPAVGSGAFPLAMLNEILKARINITEYIIRKDKEGFFDRKFGEDFIRKRRDPYKMKLSTIKNSIFAVDIEPSAVDIAKLRLWLSVVVEQEINAKNPEPHTLPNLDMNIHIGNSLIDEYEGIKLFDKSILSKKNDVVKENENRSTSEIIQMSLLKDHTDEMLREMFALQDRCFDEDNEETKKDIKDKIDQIRDELIRYKLQRDNNIDALKRYKESLKNKTKPYFIWEMEFAKIFKEKGGFDIIIGNPPYVFTRDTDLSEIKDFVTNNILKGLKGIQGGKAKQSGKINLFAIFILRTINLLKDKGILSFIIPNTLLRATVYDVVRKFILDNTSLLNIVDLGDGIFESVTASSIIIILEKNYFSENYIKITDSVFSNNISVVKQKSFNNNTSYTFNIHTNCNKDDIFNKMRTNTKLLGEIVDISCGIATQGGKSGFITNSKISEKHKPLLEGKDIKEYRVEFNSKYIIYDKDLLHRARNEESFLANEKLITQRIGGGEIVLVVAYDNKQYYTFNSTNILILKKQSQFKIKYILAILNSKLMNWFYVQNYTNGSKLTVNISKTFLNTLPIKYPSVDLEDKIVMITEKIINEYDKSFSSQSAVDIQNYKNQLNQFVYELYELTQEEIEIVENINNLEES